MFPQYTTHKINLARKKGKTPPLIVHRIYLRIRMVPTLSPPQETMVNEKFGISLKGGFCPDRHQSMGRRIYLRRKAMIHHFPISAECTFQLLHCLNFLQGKFSLATSFEESQNSWLAGASYFRGCVHIFMPSLLTLSCNNCNKSFHAHVSFS